MKGMVEVSIITPLFNKEQYVGETIKCTLDQTLSAIEMIIIDNGSTDGSMAKARQFHDARIQLFELPRRGPGAARNLGIEQSSGRWLLFLDADDLIEPNYLANRLATATSNPSAAVVAGPWEEFDGSDLSHRTLRYPAGWREPRSKLDAAAFAFAPWALHAAIVRRDHVFPSRMWNEALDTLPSEDCAFWFPVLHDTCVAWSESGGALYRKNMQDSRDRAVKSGSIGFNACLSAIDSNVHSLSRLGLKPSSAQAATVVRVLSAMLERTAKSEKELTAQIQHQIHAWLRETAYTDPRMFFRRMVFREWRAPTRYHALAGNAPTLL